MSHSDFMTAINQIAAERNINPNDVIEAIKMAIVTGFRRDYPEEEGAILEVEIDPEMGNISVYADKKVVEEVTQSSTQISLSEAKKIESKLREGDHVLVDITPSGDFGRVAAQAARQVILQKIREAEKEAVMKEFVDRIGEVDYAVVQRMGGDNVIFEIRKAVAIMPNEDRISNEFYKSGSRLKVLIKEIASTPRGKQLILSRADAKFLQALFKLEVPEIVSGSVVIMSIAREPGSRSKVAVSSEVDGVDPIGSCVGQKGVRINAIMNELKFGSQEEKIDIIAWDKNISNFIANALSPAQVLKVEILDQDQQQVKAIVPDDQLSLAIGKEGQNVRLAAKLTGWNIDIQGETVTLGTPTGKKSEKADTEASEEKEETKKTKKATKTKKKVAKKPVTKKPVKKTSSASKAKKSDFGKLELSARTIITLKKSGIEDIDSLKKALAEGKKIEGLGVKSVQAIQAKLG